MATLIFATTVLPRTAIAQIEMRFAALAKRLCTESGVSFDGIVRDSTGGVEIRLVGKTEYSLVSYPLVTMQVPRLRINEIEELWRLSKFAFFRSYCRMRRRHLVDVEATPDVCFKLHGMVGAQRWVRVKTQCGSISSVADVSCCGSTFAKVESDKLCVPSFLAVANVVLRAAVGCEAEIRMFPPALRGKTVNIEGDVLLCRSIGMYMAVIRRMCADHLPFDFFDNLLWQSAYLRDVLREASSKCEVFRLRFYRENDRACCNFEARRGVTRVFRCLKESDDTLLGIVLNELESWSMKKSKGLWFDDEEQSVRSLSKFFGGGCSVTSGSLHVVVSTTLTLVTKLTIGTFLLANRLLRDVPATSGTPKITSRLLDNSTHLAVVRAAKAPLPLQPARPRKRNNDYGPAISFPEDDTRSRETKTPDISHVSHCTPRTTERIKKCFVEHHLRSCDVTMTCSNLTGVCFAEGSKVVWSGKGNLHQTIIRGIVAICTQKSKAVTMNDFGTRSGPLKEHAMFLKNAIFGDTFYFDLQVSGQRSKLYFCTGNVRQSICVGDSGDRCWETFVGDITSALKNT